MSHPDNEQTEPSIEEILDSIRKIISEDGEDTSTTPTLGTQEIPDAYAGDQQPDVTKPDMTQPAADTPSTSEKPQDMGFSSGEVSQQKADPVFESQAAPDIATSEEWPATTTAGAPQAADVIPEPRQQAAGMVSEPPMAEDVIPEPRQQAADMAASSPVFPPETPASADMPPEDPEPVAAAQDEDILELTDLVDEDAALDLSAESMVEETMTEIPAEAEETPNEEEPLELVAEVVEDQIPAEPPEEAPHSAREEPILAETPKTEDMDAPAEAPAILLDDEIRETPETTTDEQALMADAVAMAQEMHPAPDMPSEEIAQNQPEADTASISDQPQVPLEVTMPDATSQNLMSENTASEAIDALSKLAAVTNPDDIEGGDVQGVHVTVDQMVREMIRPMLKEWLDANLPQMVEGIVSREIEKLSRKAGL